MIILTVVCGVGLGLAGWFAGVHHMENKSEYLATLHSRTNPVSGENYLYVVFRDGECRFMDPDDY
jgi:hypothetical protein